MNRRTARPSPLPRARVVAVVGPPGAGKSTLGASLAAELGFALVDRDTFYGPLAAAALPLAGVGEADLDSGPGRRLSAAAYAAAEALVRDNLSVGVGSVLVAPYSSRTEVGWFAALSERLGAVPAVVFRPADLDVVRSRLAARNLPRDRVTLDNWGRFASRVAMDAPDGPHVVVPSALDPGEALTRALGQLAPWVVSD